MHSSSILQVVKGDGMSKVLYFWELDVVAEKRGAFHAALAGWRELNAEFPEGVELMGVYETFVGHGLGPHYQLMLSAENLSKLEAAEHSPALAKLHDAVRDCVVTGTMRNRLLRQL